MKPPPSPQALVCYLEQLEDEEVRTRVAGCTALGCLKVRRMRGGGGRQGCIIRGRGSHAAGESGCTCVASRSRERGAGGARNVLEKQEGKRGGKGQGEGHPYHVLPSPPSCVPAASPVSPLSLVLQAKESIEQLVYLCQTDKEPVREAAKQSLMLCGECPATAPCTLPTHGTLGGTSQCHQHPRDKRREGGSGLVPRLPPALWLIVPQALPGKRRLAAGSGGQASCGHGALSLVVIYYLLDGTERTI